MHQGHLANPNVRLDRGAGSHQYSDMEKGESTGRMDLLPLTYGQQRSQNGAGAQGVIMAKRKEHHDMTDRQRQRDIMPGGVYVTIVKKECFIVKSSDQAALEKMEQETKTRKQQ